MKGGSRRRGVEGNAKSWSQVHIMEARHTGVAVGYLLMTAQAGTGQSLFSY